MGIKFVDSIDMTLFEITVSGAHYDIGLRHS